MMEAWVIAAHYFRRMARKPVLVVFLLAIPFTLLLAEFEAFGRAVEVTKLAPVPMRLLAGTRSPFGERVANCLQQQPGHPLDVLEVRSVRDAPFDTDLAGVSDAMHGKAFLQTQGGNADNAILESSLLQICASERPQADSQFVVQRELSVRSNIATGRDFFTHFFPGLALFGALFLSQAMASLIWRDQERTVQKRLLTTPVAPAALMLGPVLFLTAGTAVALVLILGVCALFTHPAAIESPAFWVLVAGFALCAAGLQLTLGLLAGTQRAAAAISASTSMMLAFFGGGFIPLSLYPPLLRGIAHALPNGAAQAGLTQTLNGPGNAQDMTWRVLTVLLWATILIFTAMILQRRRMRS